VESVENQTQVFHASHRPLKIPQNRRDFHISTASDDIHSLNPKTERKEVGRYAASPFSFPTLPLVERTDFMLIFQLENALGLRAKVLPCGCGPSGGGKLGLRRDAPED